MELRKYEYFVRRLQTTKVKIPWLTLIRSCLAFVFIEMVFVLYGKSFGGRG